MTNKEKDILALFNELNSMLYEVMDDYNKALSENIELKKEVAWFKKYTDALVEHKDMVCLPADLKNLRESNAALATENEELKKVIAQAWFTDVEEKDKQADIAILRTMGSSFSSIRNIFLVQGAIIAVIGTLVGLFLGVLGSIYVSDLFAWLESAIGMELLSADVYPINYLPSQLLASDLVLVCSIAIILSLLATLYPAYSAAHVDPAQTLRYE